MHAHMHTQHVVAGDSRVHDCLWKFDGVRDDNGHTISKDCLSSIILESHGIWHTYTLTYVRTYMFKIHVRMPVDIYGVRHVACINLKRERECVYVCVCICMR